MIYDVFTESGILADFSSLSPEECLENPMWPSNNNVYNGGVSLKKSNSVLTSVSASSGASVSTSSSSSSATSSYFERKFSLPSNLKIEGRKKVPTNSASKISEAYLNDNKATVHL
jgi:hypothetical protein